jgi:hypothetical protein
MSEEADRTTPAEEMANPSPDSSPPGIEEDLGSSPGKNKENDPDDELPLESPPEENDVADNELIKTTEPASDLEKALTAAMVRKDAHIKRLMDEINKLRAFIAKRKQTYKRKRKDDGAPTRALSGTRSITLWDTFVIVKMPFLIA